MTDPRARKVWGIPGDGFEYSLATATPPQEGAGKIGHIIGGEEGETEISAEMHSGWEHAVETLTLYLTENQAD